MMGRSNPYLLGVGQSVMKRSLLFVLGLAAVCYAREWTDDTGAFTVDADFDRVEGDSVWLVRPDGRKLKVSLIWEMGTLAQIVHHPVWLSDSRNKEAAKLAIGIP